MFFVSFVAGLTLFVARLLSWNNQVDAAEASKSTSR